MPRRRKATSSKAKAASATTTRSGRKSTLSLKTNNANLTLETTDSNLVSNILAQFDVTPSGGAAKAAAPKKRGRRPGRPAKAGRKPAAKKAAAPVPSLKLSKTAISAAMKGANPTNHEQRILALAKIAKKSGAKEITTKDIETYASATGISQSTIPGSLSKLRGRKHLSVRKDGRRAFYSLTAAGESEADKVLSGKAKAARRGRKSSGKTAAKKTTAKKRGPAKKTAAKKTTARKAKPGPKPGAKRGRKPGPKPGAKRGRKPGPKPGAGRKKTTAAAKKKPASSPAKTRGATPTSSLDAAEKKQAEKLINAPFSGSADKLSKFDTPKDRSLYLLQSLGGATSEGVKANVLSNVLNERFKIAQPANGIGAALKKASKSKLVDLKDGNKYSITIEGRKYVDSLK